MERRLLLKGLGSSSHALGNLTLTSKEFYNKWKEERYNPVYYNGGDATSFERNIQMTLLSVNESSKAVCVIFFFSNAKLLIFSKC